MPKKCRGGQKTRPICNGTSEATKTASKCSWRSSGIGSREKTAGRSIPQISVDGLDCFTNLDPDIEDKNHSVEQSLSVRPPWGLPHRMGRSNFALVTMFSISLLG